MLGKEYTLGKQTNPLLNNSQGLGLSGQQTQHYLEKHKLLMHIEGLDDLNLEILRKAQIALSAYKAKNKLMETYDTDSAAAVYKFMKVQCNRMIHFMHLHLYSHIFEMKSEQDLVMKNDPILSQICSIQNFVVNASLLKEAQRYRDMVVA